MHGTTVKNSENQWKSVKNCALVGYYKNLKRNCCLLLFLQYTQIIPVTLSRANVMELQVT